MCVNGSPALILVVDIAQMDYHGHLESHSAYEDMLLIKVGGVEKSPG